MSQLFQAEAALSLTRQHLGGIVLLLALQTSSNSDSSGTRYLYCKTNHLAKWMRTVTLDPMHYASYYEYATCLLAVSGNVLFVGHKSSGLLLFA